MEPMIIYHRGRHGVLPDGRVVPENSLLAFEEALRAGAEMIEFDVWTGLRVTHDPDTTGAVPLLPEVLDLIRGRSALNIEIKSPLAAQDTFAVIERAFSNGSWKPEQVVLSSFHHETAIRAKKAFPALRVGALLDSVPLSPYVELLHAERIDNLHLHWSNVYMDIENGSALATLTRRLGMQIWVWTVNTQEVFDVVTRYGAQSVFSDAPALLR